VASLDASYVARAHALDARTSTGGTTHEAALGGSSSFAGPAWSVHDNARDYLSDGLYRLVLGLCSTEQRGRVPTDRGRIGAYLSRLPPPRLALLIGRRHKPLSQISSR